MNKFLEEVINLMGKKVLWAGKEYIVRGFKEDEEDNWYLLENIETNKIEYCSCVLGLEEINEI